jgi:hypothetical protein
MSCEDIRVALSEFGACVETDHGSRVTTHCLYPSFDPVSVFVVRFGDGFKVHDGGGATRSAWIHGRDPALINRMLNRYASRYQVAVSDDAIVADVPSPEWLPIGILSVANASAATAHAAVEHFVAASESLLRDRIFSVLRQTVPETTISKEASVPGRSGKLHRFDFIIQMTPKHMILIDAVAPHHISIASKYVAFSDVRAIEQDPYKKFAVHDRPLATDDVALLQQVADIVPFKSLRPGLIRVTPRLI